ncbi:hypothetical protein U1707_18720 [Sphingomonas sp. PB2P12]|uniref:hypothetical protein n=1 Tax=Sphingomonas sandaracina TaxID=3096157 RepID=UPI002FC74214
MVTTPLPSPETDSGPKLVGNEDGTEGHYSGEEYDSYQKKQPRNVEVGASRGNRKANVLASNAAADESIPADAGRRAYIDEKTGEVHGSGAGAGGGNPTEDYGANSTGGGGEVRETQSPKH